MVVEHRTVRLDVTINGIEETEQLSTLARLAVELENLLAAKQYTVQLDRKELFKTLQSLQQQKAHLRDGIQALYEEFIDGAISRDAYASKKQSLTLRLEGHDQQIAALEEKTSCFDAPNNKAAIEAFKGYAAVDTLSNELSSQLLGQITVYPDDELSIQLNFQNELKALAQAIFFLSTIQCLLARVDSFKRWLKSSKYSSMKSQSPAVSAMVLGLATKNKLYSDYKQARQEMVDLQMAKHNIDRVLGVEQQAKTIKSMSYEER